MGKTNVYKIEIFGYTYNKAATSSAKAKNALARQLEKKFKGRASNKTELKRFMKVTKIG